jgi:Flp pilus assembly protein TadG
MPGLDRQSPFKRGYRKLRGLRDGDGSSLVEFAIAIPLLVVLVVGIFDFGGAFNTKQELNNAMREGARFAATQPTNDLDATPLPPSVAAVRTVVDSYMKIARINDCALDVAAGTGTGLTWTFTTTSAGGCSGTLTLTIIRGAPTCNFQATGYGTPNPITVNVPCSQVKISYPYQWHFNNVIQLIVPGANYGNLLQIQTDATAPNMN